jgi:alpha-galactosidase
MVHYLRAAGTSLVLDARGTAVPVVVHWGADLGALSVADLAALADSAVPAIPPSSVDIPLRLSLLPTPREGWSGRPGITGFRAGDGTAALDLRLVEACPTGPLVLVLLLTDAAAGLDLRTDIELSVEGVLRLRHTLTNTADSTFELGSLDITLPVPDRAAEILDFTGLWTHERRPQRSILGHGVWSSCSTTAGSPADPTIVARSATGSSTRRGGRTGCTR